VQDWQILVVDDEPDVHRVTELALRNKRWRGRKFTVTTASSAKEPRSFSRTSATLRRRTVASS